MRTWWWFRPLTGGMAALLAGAGGAGTVAAEGARPARADWPGDERGLVFLWNDASRANQVSDPNAAEKRACRVHLRGAATFYRFSDMDLAGGAFLAEDVDERLLAACKASNRLAIEAVVTPGRADRRGTGAIVSFSGDGPARNFKLAQQGDRLVLELRTSRGPAAKPVPLCKLTADRPQHVIVSCEPGRVACWLDGNEVAVNGSPAGDFRNWTPQHLVFGDEYAGGRDWVGRLEGIAIYARSIAGAEAKRKCELYRLRLANRDSARRIVLEGKLVEAARTPTLEGIHPYRGCLAVHTYQITKVLEGEYRRRRILVAHWVILDAKPLGFRREVGRTYRLVVEVASEYPQLGKEAKVVSEADQVYGEMYYDVEAAHRLPSAAGPAAPDGALAEALRAACAARYKAAEAAYEAAVVSSDDAAIAASMVVEGKDGWLFQAGELRHVGVGPFWGEAAAKVSRARKDPDPLPAILDYKASLDKLGIELVLLPVPPKAIVYADKLLAKVKPDANGTIPRLDTAHQAFYKLLAAKGVRVLDLTDAFLAARGRGEQMYCKQDTHWSGRACVLAAKKVHEMVAGRKWLAGAPTRKFEAEERQVQIRGDLWRDMRSPKPPRETLPLRFVGTKGPNGLEPVAGDAASAVVLLADSHGLVFHRGGEMHARGAGLADQLAMEFGLPVDCIAVLGSGITPVRTALFRKQRSTPGYLKAKKLLIWCFAAREFTEADDGWRMVPVTGNAD